MSNASSVRLGGCRAQQRYTAGEPCVYVFEVKKTRKPSVKFGVTKDDRLQVEFGADGAPLHPIQYFKCLKGLLTMTWRVTYNNSLTWDLSLADMCVCLLPQCLLQSYSRGNCICTRACARCASEHGFFTLDEYASKEYTQSVVMPRDAANGTALRCYLSKRDSFLLLRRLDSSTRGERKKRGTRMCPRRLVMQSRRSVCSNVDSSGLRRSVRCDKKKRAGVHEDDELEHCGGDVISDIKFVSVPALTFDIPGIRNLPAPQGSKRIRKT